MTDAASRLLKAFEELSTAEQSELAVEILRRAPIGGELPESAFDELADDLFLSYDAEEERSDKR
ncbi:MAG: hypothetical protein KY475_07595 [Planctomycetes bacterium]|nr:hypothetical protein [Planctomycetota bacterium]